jgi:hypothetical protein
MDLVLNLIGGLFWNLIGVLVWVLIEVLFCVVLVWNLIWCLFGMWTVAAV